MNSRNSAGASGAGATGNAEAHNLESLFHPRSIALAGITVANPEHWTRTFLSALLEFKFEPLYLVNPRGGEIDGLKVYRSLKEVPGNIDYVISTVPARVAPALIEESAEKGVKAIQFCTSGFGETGEAEGTRLEAELSETARRKRIRVLGPNCMGIYCPESRLSFEKDFPRESGPVGFISQSGGNTTSLIKQTMWRGVRFNKAVSYGNASDLNESDFLEYFAADPDIKIIVIYIEGVKDGARFRRALEKAARQKPVILLKGGTTDDGARAVRGHTGALAGNEATWDSLCKQLGVIRVHSIEEMSNVLVTLLFMPRPAGKRAALLGSGGGASVLITDEFARRGIEVPPLPRQIIDRIREFTPIAGNILRNPIDYSQTLNETDSLAKTLRILSGWEDIDFIIIFLRSSLSVGGFRMVKRESSLLKAVRSASKPVAFVLELSLVSKETRQIFTLTRELVASRIPVYYSFDGAADAIRLVADYSGRTDHQGTGALEG
ncbi:MAG: CoA-binding protein [Chloroflexi bacterium]|nr:CoA-binding protein [Chloroflexota bacterium]